MPIIPFLTNGLFLLKVSIWWPPYDPSKNYRPFDRVLKLGLNRGCTSLNFHSFPLHSSDNLRRPLLRYVPPNQSEPSKYDECVITSLERIYRLSLSISIIRFADHYFESALYGPSWKEPGMVLQRWEVCCKDRPDTFPTLVKWTISYFYSYLYCLYNNLCRIYFTDVEISRVEFWNNAYSE
jgi:hypothetical protein